MTHFPSLSNFVEKKVGNQKTKLKFVKAFLNVGLVSSISKLFINKIGGEGNFVME